MVMARFAVGVAIDHDGVRKSEWLAFVHEVNTARPDTFGKPDIRENYPRAPYESEVYPTAVIIHPPHACRSEGIRITTDDPDTMEAFRTAAQTLGITLAG